MNEHADIYGALCAAQAEFEAPKRATENSHFKSHYADLAAVVAAVKAALNSHGVAYFHIPTRDEFGMGMRTTLRHAKSGTEISADVPLLLGKQDMQGYKAATTYAKRIGLESVTGVAPDDDDDAEADRKGGMPSMGAAIGDAWRDAVMDNLPPNATPRQTAEAFTKAICEDFKGKGLKALENRWDRHAKMIGQLHDRFPDLWEQCIDAFENRKNDITEGKAA